MNMWSPGADMWGRRPGAAPTSALRDAQGGMAIPKPAISSMRRAVAPSGAIVTKWETKLKLGRKLEGVDAGTASDNQVSVLFRHDEAGQDGHISMSIESDRMTAEDVAAVFETLAQRGIFTRENTKIWVSQPQASEQKFGSTKTWKGTDIGALASRLKQAQPQHGSGMHGGGMHGSL